MTAVDPATWKHLPPMPDQGDGRPNFWRRAPRWIFHGAATVGALALLWAQSYPIENPWLAVWAFLWLAVCALIWLVRLVAYLVGLRSPSPSGRWPPFLVAPIAGVVVLFILSSSAPLQARWAASEAAFDARADTLLTRAEAGRGESAGTELRGERVGLYVVEDAYVDQYGNAYFVIAGSGFIDRGGFVRLAGQRPPRRDAHEVRHLGGAWYSFVQPF